MTFQVEISNSDGRVTDLLGPFGNVPSARQAILDHACIIDLPVEEPFHCPSLRVVEGWFVDRTEYCILQA